MSTKLTLPQIIYGTSCLGNLYEELPYERKLALGRAWFQDPHDSVALDSAGKYGAGLALETAGRILRDLQIPPEHVLISNKLGWKRIPLKSQYPSFERDIWKNLQYDAEQRISYEGIMECWAQGCELIGKEYKPSMLSVHDPDEYLAAASSSEDRKARLHDISEAYRALNELKKNGEVRYIGIGAKNWQVIREITGAIELDWIMFACSLTVYTHPQELLKFIEEAHKKGITLINSAVFNSGFLVGGSFFDYLQPSPLSEGHLFEWREKFFSLCREFELSPEHVCLKFSFEIPGISSIALNSSRPEKIERNKKMLQGEIPREFWKKMQDSKLIAEYLNF